MGVFGTDLAALLWGGGFLFFCIYALAGAQIGRGMVWNRFRVSDSGLGIGLPTRSVPPGRPCEADVAVPVPRFVVPGLQMRLVARLVSGTGRSVTLDVPMAAGRGRYTARLTPRGRGVYQGEAATIAYEDVLGLARAERSVPAPLRLIVRPEPWDVQTSPRLFAAGGEHQATRRDLRRNDELLEVRKYFPGDDLRRVNWKLYAHAGELFLRIGEENPPPEARLAIVLDTAPGARCLPPSARRDYLDQLVAYTAGFCRACLARNVELRFVCPGLAGPITPRLEAMEPLYAALAAVTWSNEAVVLPPRDADVHLLIITTPDSPALAKLAAEETHRSGRCSLFVKEYHAPLPASPPRIRNVLVLPERPPTAGGAHPTRECLAALESRLAGVLATYRSPRWSMHRVERV